MYHYHWTFRFLEKERKPNRFFYVNQLLEPLPMSDCRVLYTVGKLLSRAFQRYMTHDNQTLLRVLKVDLCRKNGLVFSLFLKNGKSNGNDTTYTIGKLFKRGIQVCI